MMEFFLDIFRWFKTIVFQRRERERKRGRWHFGKSNFRSIQFGSNPNSSRVSTEFFSPPSEYKSRVDPKLHCTPFSRSTVAIPQFLFNVSQRQKKVDRQNQISFFVIIIWFSLRHPIRKLYVSPADVLARKYCVENNSVEAQISSITYKASKRALAILFIGHE